MGRFGVVWWVDGTGMGRRGIRGLGFWSERGRWGEKGD